MRSYRVTRTEALSFGCTGLLLLLAAQLPAMRHLGYPLAVVTTAPAFVFGVITASNALPAWRAAGLAWLLYALGVEPIWGCDTLGGLTWTLLGPITGAALGLGVGRTLRYRLGLASWRYGAAIAGLIVLDLVALAWRLYDQPQVMVLDPIIGYIHGPIYDDWVPIEGPVVTGRLLTLAAAAGLAVLSVRRTRRALDLALALSAVWCLTFDALPNRGDLERALPRAIERSGFTVRFAPSQARPARRIAAEAEAHVADLSTLIYGAPEPPEKVTIWLYPDADSKRRLMGARHVLIARPWQNEIHLHPTRSPDPHLRHELIHALLAHQSDNFLGVPLNPLPNPALIEGLAVYLGPGISRMSLHQAAAALHRRGRLPSLSELLGLRFSLAQGRTAYRAAGSLMKFVADRYGFDRLLTAYHGGSLEAAGLDSAQVGREWLTLLEETPEPEQARRSLLRLYARQPLLKRSCPNEVEEAWRHAQRSGERSNDEVEADYRAVMALSGDCRPLGSLADRYHRRGDAKARRRIEDELIQRGLSSAQAATLFERRADEAIAAADVAAASAHLRRALAAAPAEHRYRGLLVRALTEEHPELVRAVAPYLTTGAGAEAVSARLASAYPQLPAPAAAAAAYLLMRYHGNRGDFEQLELWGLRAQPLPRTLSLETERYLAQRAEAHNKPCLAAARWRSLAQHQPAVADRLAEHLARLRFRAPDALCRDLASAGTP